MFTDFVALDVSQINGSVGVQFLTYKPMYRLILAFTVLALTGCATPPTVHNINNTLTFQKSYDSVWEDIVRFLASRNIQIKNIAKDSGVIYAEAARFDDAVADCGTPGIFLVVGRRATFNVFVNRATDNQTVIVNTEFVENRRFQENLTTVTCNSKGVLEDNILSSIGR